MKKIKDIIESLVNEHGTSDPFKLCEKLKINLSFLNFDERLHGAYVKTETDTFISVNNNLEMEKRIFVLAHELGHAILHKDKGAMQLFTNLEKVNECPLEVEAELFAKELTSIN